MTFRGCTCHAFHLGLVAVVLVLSPLAVVFLWVYLDQIYSKDDAKNLLKNEVVNKRCRTKMCRILSKVPTRMFFTVIFQAIFKLQLPWTGKSIDPRSAVFISKSEEFFCLAHLQLCLGIL